MCLTRQAVQYELRSNDDSVDPMSCDGNRSNGRSLQIEKRIGASGATSRVAGLLIAHALKRSGMRPWRRSSGGAVVAAQ